ncbi:beta-ketoacyl-ACP synthase [Fragilaria crotonensis]|nr:beta-ketoacyl-ACP synthase [Fragilaria crotonensis]
MMVHTPTTKSIVMLIAAVAATQSSVSAFAPNVNGFGRLPTIPGLTFSKNVRIGNQVPSAGHPALTDEDFKELIPKSSLRFCGNNAKYAYVAMERAVQDSGLTPEMYQENPRVAGIIGRGTSIPDIVETVDAVQNAGKRWKNKVGPFRVTRSMGSTCSAVLATAFKLQGPSFSISSACSTGAHCIGTGFEQIGQE